MKRILAILFASLILVSGMHFTVASHRCCGELAGVKYSFTGARASCGMEEDQSTPAQNGTIRTDCCKDYLTSFAVDNHYFPTFDLTKATQLAWTLSPAICLSGELPNPAFRLISQAMTGPPGKMYPNAVDRTLLCIFII